MAYVQPQPMDLFLRPLPFFEEVLAAFTPLLAPPTLVRLDPSPLEGCHGVSAQPLVESPRNGLGCEPVPRVGLGSGEPESPHSLAPFCRVFFPSAYCPFGCVPLEAPAFIGGPPCCRFFGVGTVRGSLARTVSARWQMQIGRAHV